MVPATPLQAVAYERTLRAREIEVLLGAGPVANNDDQVSTTLDPSSLARARQLVFTHEVTAENLYREPTWQAIIENGLAGQLSARKDPKYVTHGLHQYKANSIPNLPRA